MERRKKEERREEGEEREGGEDGEKRKAGRGNGEKAKKHSQLSVLGTAVQHGDWS